MHHYLEHYVAALDMVILPEQKTIVVNPESLFVYLSPAIREDYGLDGADYRTASYVDLPPIRQIAPSCVAEDSECLATLKVQQYISSQNHQGEIQLFLKQKTPVIDPASKSGVGVRVDFFPIYSLGHFKPYINSHIVQYVPDASQVSSRQKIELTMIEELILFLLIMYVKPKVVTMHLNAILHKDITVSTDRKSTRQNSSHITLSRMPSSA